MALSPLARNKLITLEGNKLVAYPDPATGGEPWTIGVGHTGGIKQGFTCTHEQSMLWLDQDVAEAEAIINHWVSVPLTQAMRDALILFIFNIGPGYEGKKDGFVWLKDGRHSTLLTLLNQGRYQEAANEFLKWNHAAGREMDGLTSRRRDEREWFLSEGMPGDPQEHAPVAPEPGPGATNEPSPTPTPIPQPATQPRGFPAGEADPVYDPPGASTMTTPTLTDVVDSPITKFLLAAVNPILGIVPEVAHLFMDKNVSVPERNLAAATKLVQVAQGALQKANVPATNAQAVVEAIQTNAEATKVVRDAVLASYFELTTIGGGPEAARKADLAMVQAGASDKWALLKSPSFVMGVFLLPLVYLIVLNVIGVLGSAQWSPEARAGIAGMITGTIVGGLVGYYYGQSTSRNRSSPPDPVSPAN